MNIILTDDPNQYNITYDYDIQLNESHIYSSRPNLTYTNSNTSAYPTTDTTFYANKFTLSPSNYVYDRINKSSYQVTIEHTDLAFGKKVYSIFFLTPNSKCNTLDNLELSSLFNSQPNTKIAYGTNADAIIFLFLTPIPIKQSAKLESITLPQINTFYRIKLTEGFEANDEVPNTDTQTGSATGTWTLEKLENLDKAGMTCRLMNIDEGSNTNYSPSANESLYKTIIMFGMALAFAFMFVFGVPFMAKLYMTAYLSDYGYINYVINFVIAFPLFVADYVESNRWSARQINLPDRDSIRTLKFRTTAHIAAWTLLISGLLLGYGIPMIKSGNTNAQTTDGTVLIAVGAAYAGFIAFSWLSATHTLKIIEFTKGGIKYVADFKASTIEPKT